MKGKESYNNLIDFCIAMDESPNKSEDGAEIFMKVLKEFFFIEEGKEKGMMNFFNNFDIPDFVKDISSMLDVDVDKMVHFIEGNTVADSLTGKFYTSTAYLKIFHSNHPPEFSKIPPDVQNELIEKIKKKNMQIAKAFKKIQADKESDKKRTLCKLVALVLKNIHLRTGLNFVDTEEPAMDIIKKEFNGADDIFTASQIQVADLNDDTKIKKIVKKFFKVKNFKDITDITEQFKKEVERFKKRALRVQP